MALCYCLKMFGDGLDGPTPDEGDGGLDYGPDIFCELHQGLLCSYALFCLRDFPDSLQKDRVLDERGDVHNDPFTEL